MKVCGLIVTSFDPSKELGVVRGNPIELEVVLRVEERQQAFQLGKFVYDTWRPGAVSYVLAGLLAVRSVVKKA